MHLYSTKTNSVISCAHVMSTAMTLIHQFVIVIIFSCVCRAVVESVLKSFSSDTNTSAKAEGLFFRLGRLCHAGVYLLIHQSKFETWYCSVTSVIGSMSTGL